MSRKNKTTEEVVTDPERIADLAKQFRERGEMECAEIVEIATQVFVQKKGDRVIGFTVPLDATSAAKRAVEGGVVRRRGKFTEVITDRQRIADLARLFRELGDIDSAETFEAATEVRVVTKGDRLDHFESPGYALPESARNSALNAIVSSRGSRH